LSFRGPPSELFFQVLIFSDKKFFAKSKKKKKGSEKFMINFGDEKKQYKLKVKSDFGSAIRGARSGRL
jgi:hypothetical protein